MIGTMASGERFEWDNVVDVPANAVVVRALHAQLVDVVKQGLVKPFSSEETSED